MLIMTNNISDDNKSIEGLKIWKAIIPTVIGLLVVAYLLFRNFEEIDFSLLHFSYFAVLFLIIAFLMMFMRDFGYMLRLKILSSNQLTWRKCLRIIMLWEFTSAVTPSAVGGTTLATIYIWKEGLPIGKSTAIVIATSFLDELYFSIVFPIFLLCFPFKDLFPANANVVYDNLLIFALIGYFVKLLWTCLMGYSIFFNPAFFAKLIKKLFNFKLLRRWLPLAEKMANEFEVSNSELKNKKFKFWVKAFTASFVSWSARFFVLNFLLVAFIFVVNVEQHQLASFYNQLLIFARQFILWIMMLVMPTPGASGFAEIVFSSYMKDLVSVKGYEIFLAFVWRIVTYYPYLLIGIIIVPKWLLKHYKRK